MEKNQAKNLIKQTFNQRFDKDIFREFIINLLDGINEQKAFFVGNAQVKEAFQKYISSYKRVGQYTDKNSNVIDVLVVHLNDNCSLDRNRTMLRNFVADYMKTRQKENTLVAFYNDTNSDWRFSFVKLEMSLKQDEKGKVKVVNEFTSAKRFSFLVGELEPNHTAQSRLVSLLEKDYPTLNEIEEAFNVEKVSKEFFANYKELFLQLVDDLKEIRKNDERINYEFTLKSIKESDFCKKLLGQLVFLYFIQKKGWLGVPVDKKWGEGDKQFLRHTFEKAVKEGKNFFNDYLEHLFYDALANGERDNNYFGLLNCKIPFLNGGLFETIGGYSWTETDIILDNTIFSNNEKTKNGDIGTGILDVFDRYNFTVKEDEPLEKEVAVDPEMLGKVFEELLEVEDRKSKGAFYTPREIVHYMCQESLINYLATELNATEEETIEVKDSEQMNLIQPQTQQLDFSNILTKQAISDFIHHSDKLSQSEFVASEKDNKNSKYQHKIHPSIINNAEKIDKALENIKICDPAIGSGAFPVGMLNEIVRARIALVESGFLRETKKRSIYEYKRQAIQNSIYGVDIEAGAVEIAKLRLWLSLVVDEEDIENIKALPNLDYKIVCGNSLLNVERNLFNDILYRKLEELKPQFFNETRKSEKKRLKKEIDEIIKELTKDGTFDFEIYFSEVFHEKGGFDIIIANPPYGADIDDYIKLFEKLYPETSKAYKDIYKYFFDKSLKILKNNGVLTFITPNTFLRQPRYSDLRQLLLKQKINIIVDFGDNIFEEAVVPTAIIILDKIQIPTNRLYYSDLTQYKNPKTMINNQKLISIHQEKWNNKTTNYSFSNMDFILNEKIILLDEILEMKDAGINYQRVKVGLSEKGKSDLGKRLLYEGEKQKITDVEFWKGSDISAYYISAKTSRFCNTSIKLKANERIIINKSYFSITPKLIWRQTAEYPIVTIDKKGLWFGRSIQAGIIKQKYLSQLNYEYLCALLNSALLRFKYSVFVKEEGKVFPQVKLEKLKPLPIFIADEDIQNKFVTVVDKILAITQTEDYLQNEEKQNAVKEYEKQIDIMVYKLYELTYEEVLTIDKDFSLTEQEYNDYQL